MQLWITPRSLFNIIVTPPDDALRQRPILFIKNNVTPEDAKNYQITIERDAKPGEPCLTISWKSNPDGSEPAEPQIYMVNGYFNIKPPSVLKT